MASASITDVGQSEKGAGSSAWLRLRRKIFYLVPAQDSEALSVALLRLLRDPKLSRRLAEAGRKRATHDFSDERLMREMGELYTELLEPREIRR